MGWHGLASSRDVPELDFLHLVLLSTQKGAQAAPVDVVASTAPAEPPVAIRALLHAQGVSKVKITKAFIVAHPILGAVFPRNCSWQREGLTAKASPAP